MHTFLVQLPQNYAFFSRLPSRFHMLVLDIENTTSKGDWYSVKIQGQILRILSQRKLQIGERYLLEKKTPLEFTVLKHLAQKDPKESASELSNKNFSQTWSLDSILEYSENNIIAFFTNLLAMHFLEEKTKSSIVQTGKENYFFQIVFNAQTIQGVFAPKKNNWILYLALPKEILGNKEHLDKKKEDLEALILENLNGLPIEQVRITQAEIVKQLSTGIDIFR